MADFLAVYGILVLGVVGIVMLVASFAILINCYCEVDE